MTEEIKIYGPSGQLLSSPPDIQMFRKESPPALGPSYGGWAGLEDQRFFHTMPGGSSFYFDTSKLTLADYRQMRNHPQINSSLSILSFMIHQIEWHIECDDKRIAESLEENMRDIWTRLVRALVQALWAGYSPSALEYEYNPRANRIEITKIKDLPPEECRVHWKKVKGAVSQHGFRPTFYIFDGIDQFGYPTIPPENSFWYPLQMENGDHYGRKLLRPAFVPWYFSILMHLFTNRYFERFGEPTPVGRAPFEDEVVIDNEGKTVSGLEAMRQALASLRNRGVVTLPSSKTPDSKDFEYSIEYVESDMRGMDFERYLERLDEEISLAIFTPVLLFRSAQNGSHSLGVQHAQTFMWMINAIAGDMKEYIDKYILWRLKAFNYGTNTPSAKFEFRKLGKENIATVRAIITEMIRKDQAKANLFELGQAVGLSIEEIDQVTENPPNDPVTAPDDRVGRDRSKVGKRGPSMTEPVRTGREISHRLAGQVDKAWRQGSFDGVTLDFGFKRSMTRALADAGLEPEKAKERANEMYERFDIYASDLLGMGVDAFSSPEEFMSIMNRHVDREINDAIPR